MHTAHTNTNESAGVLQVLLAEQRHIDAQIETMMDLEIKVLAFLFPALAAAAGWILGADEKHPLSKIAQGEVLLVLIAVMCFGILLSVICYCLSAEYSRYKSDVLGCRLQQLLNSDNSLDARSWGKSDVGQTLVFAITGLWITISAALCTVLVVATRLLWGTSSLTLRTSLCLSYVISIVTLLSVVLSLNRGVRGGFGRLIAARLTHSHPEHD
ncbi:MAG TPA: hypothetical protein VGN39_14390 [Terriglobales bacterium]|jgi:hypothetical protein|nr:hypothetical protein [Terriglobales bacterium]